MTDFPDLVVNGETIPRHLIAAETQHHYAPASESETAWRKAANAIAIRTLLLQEAQRQNINEKPLQIKPGIYESTEEAIIRRLLDQCLQVKLPTENEIRAEWERNTSRFHTQPLWEVSHILCSCNTKDQQALKIAHDKAKCLTKLALSDEQDFALLARQESDCPSKTTGGKTGQIRPGDTEIAFETALRLLKEGDITPEPVLTRHGYHIIRMDAIAAGQQLPYQAVRTKISDALEKAAWVRTARDFVARLVANADISGSEIAGLLPTKK